MSRFGQVGIALGALGIMVALMGLFPNLTGLEDTPGIGVVQVFMLLVGFAMLVFGALLYAKVTFFLGTRGSLAQQIGIRFAMTGLVFASLAGLSDILGFGSHLRTETTDIYFGYWQAFGLLASFALSSFGVVMYVVAGQPRLSEDALRDDMGTEIPAPVASDEPEGN